jgi:hypothetical protein
VDAPSILAIPFFLFLHKTLKNGGAWYPTKITQKKKSKKSQANPHIKSTNHKKAPKKQLKLFPIGSTFMYFYNSYYAVEIKKKRKNVKRRNIKNEG